MKSWEDDGKILEPTTRDQEHFKQCQAGSHLIV